MKKSKFVVATVLSISLSHVFAAQPLEGRYVIFFSPHARADTFLVDTHTGDIWQMQRFMYLKGQPQVWAPMNRFDDEAGRREFERAYGHQPHVREMTDADILDRPPKDLLEGSPPPPAGFQPDPPERR